MDQALPSCFDGIRPQALHDATMWYPEAGGKRLRPIMALLACEAAGGSADDALPVALAVELVHNFSLVHDDIMDRDATRRGRQTVHTKWDEATAILAGDVLFARAFEVLARIPDPAAHQEASRLLSTAIRRLCEGQAMDVAFERENDVTVAAYLDMIRGKTAILFAAACHGGALAHRRASRPHIESLDRFGEAFGMAFQIADDLLDVTAPSEKMGKPWGSDVRAGKRTILVLEALARADGRQRETIRAALGRHDATDAQVRAAVDAMRACGALAAAEALRDEHAKAAADALAPLPETDAKRTLLALNGWARTRGF
ncbi:MAG: geranylgeranyl diphosphate synthase, type [Thermoplasmata archaeon]|nr:geranylgeranyl diphosphate synthase, type [Thermoplasmata archaeon]